MTDIEMGEPDGSEPSALTTRSWRDNAPAMLLDTFTDAHGAPCFTSLDRRWLWRLEQHLVICGTTQYHRDMARDLRQYLNETCEHHWSVWPGDEHIEAHRQCTWCNHVEWGPASPSAASKEENQ